MFRNTFAGVIALALLTVPGSVEAASRKVERVFAANVGSYLGYNGVTNKPCVLKVYKDDTYYLDITFSASAESYAQPLETVPDQFRKKWFRQVLVSKETGLQIQYDKKRENVFKRVQQFKDGKLVNDCFDVGRATPEYIFKEIYGEITSHDAEDDEEGGEAPLYDDPFVMADQGCPQSHTQLWVCVPYLFDPFGTPDLESFRFREVVVCKDNGASADAYYTHELVFLAADGTTISDNASSSTLGNKQAFSMDGFDDELSFVVESFSPGGRAELMVNGEHEETYVCEN